MILVDSTVVIDFARGNDAKLQSLFLSLNLAVCGIVRAETLAGVRSTADRGKLLAILNALGQVSIPETIWEKVGDNLRELRRNGLTLPFPDVVIATLGIENQVEVWTRDRHYPAMQKVLPILQLYQEPP